MAVAFVKDVSGGSTSTVQNPTAVFGSNVTAGNLIVVLIDWGDATNTITSVTDTRGNTYAAAATRQANTLSTAIYWTKNGSSGANTVTVNFNTAVAGPDVIAIEVSGYTNPGVDVFNSGTGTSGNASSGNITTTTANEFLAAICEATGVTGTGTAGWTIQGTLNANSYQYKIRTTTGTEAATYTGTGGSWVAMVAAFKEVASGTTQKITAAIAPGATVGAGAVRVLKTSITI